MSATHEYGGNPVEVQNLLLPLLTNDQCQCMIANHIAKIHSITLLLDCQQLSSLIILIHVYQEP